MGKIDDVADAAVDTAKGVSILEKIEDVRPVQIVSKEKIVSMAKEAFNSRDVYITLGNQIYINGISKNGVKFEGWINSITKELDSFYPVKQWQFEY